jgi:hypothetical protein
MERSFYCEIKLRTVNHHHDHYPKQFRFNGLLPNRPDPLNDSPGHGRARGRGRGGAATFFMDQTGLSLCPLQWPKILTGKYSLTAGIPEKRAVFAKTRKFSL